MKSPAEATPSPASPGRSPFWATLVNLACIQVSLVAWWTGHRNLVLATVLGYIATGIWLCYSLRGDRKPAPKPKTRPTGPVVIRKPIPINDANHWSKTWQTSGSNPKALMDRIDSMSEHEDFSFLDGKDVTQHVTSDAGGHHE